jgi:hypothetical protein
MGQKGLVVMNGILLSHSVESESSLIMVSAAATSEGSTCLDSQWR